MKGKKRWTIRAALFMGIWLCVFPVTCGWCTDGTSGEPNASTSVAQAPLPQATEEWVQRYDGSANGDDQAAGIALDPSGNVIVTGSSAGPNSSDILTIKYDSTGNKIWEKRYDGIAHYGDEPNAIAVDGSGNVFVAGFSNTYANSYDYVVIKYDADGNEKWVATWDDVAHGGDFVKKLVVDGSGNAIVTGFATKAGSSYPEYVTVKFNASDGKRLWARRVIGANGDWYRDPTLSLAVDAPGNIYVACSPWVNYYRAFILEKYAPDGSLLWRKWYYYNKLGHDNMACALALDGAGSGYVAGGWWTSQRGWDYKTMKFDALNGGNLLWTRTKGYLFNDIPSAMTVDASGSVIVTGTRVTLLGTTNYFTIKYDPTGVRLWSTIFNGPANGDDKAVALAVDSSGNIVVTGTSQGLVDSWNDMATIKYDILGNPVWEGRYNGVPYGSESAKAVTVDSSGAVYVAGSSQNANGNWDIVTIKYSK